MTITDANHPQGQPFDVMDGEVAQEDFDELSGDVDDLKSAKVNKPSTSPNGTSGQLLRTNGDGTTTWVDQGLPTDAQTAEAVSDWLDDHPEATTTVQDNSVTDAKLVQSGGILDTARKLGQHNIFTELYNARYVGHKGFNGWISGTTAKPAVQSNSLMALDLAKSLGIKFVETDTTILSDGTWVISHDLDTQNMSRYFPLSKRINRPADHGKRQ